MKITFTRGTHIYKGVENVKIYTQFGLKKVSIFVTKFCGTCLVKVVYRKNYLSLVLMQCLVHYWYQQGQYSYCCGHSNIS